MRKFFKRFTNFVKQHQSIIFWALFLGMILLRVWLITGVPKMLIYGPHDDLFYARAAQSILRGQWMGVYNQMTLIKGPFYAFFLIGSFFTGLPLYLNESMFYISACAVLFVALKPIVESRWWRLFCFFLVLFLPSSMATWFNLRVYREFVYFSLTLFVTAFAIGLFLRLDQKLSTILFWSVGLGVSMGAFMLTREEGVWIYPILFLLFIAGILLIWRSRTGRKAWRAVLILLPILLWYIPILLVSWLNYSHYGFWGVTENLDPEFNRVLTTLARIETVKDWHPAIQISQTARLAAYEVSPALAKYQDMIESYVPGWNHADDGIMAMKPAWYRAQYGDGGGEIGNGHFIWLMRDMAAHSGHYNHGIYPQDFYREIANELELACNKGTLACKPKSPLPAAVGAIDRRHIPIITRMFAENLYHLVNMDLEITSLNIDVSWPAWPQNNDEYWVFEQFTYNPVETVNTISDENLPKIIYGVTDLRYRMIQYKESFMNIILKGYQLISLPFFGLGLAAWIVLMVTTIRHRNKNWQRFPVLSSFVLGLLITRLMTLTIIDATTSIPGIAYMASIQIFVLIFSSIALVWTINYIRENNSGLRSAKKLIKIFNVSKIKKN